MNSASPSSSDNKTGPAAITHSQASYNDEAERAVLACMLLSHNALDRSIAGLRSDDFSSHHHILVYEVIAALYEKQEKITLITLKDGLNARHSLKKVGGVEFLASLTRSSPLIEDVDSYIRLVRRASLRRQLLELCGRTVRSAQDAAYDIEDLIVSAESDIYHLTRESFERQQSTGHQDLFSESVRSIEERMDNPKDYSGVPSGYHDLDRATNGFQLGDLIIVAGRPSMGKTAFALNVANHIALNDNGAVAIFSLEMSGEMIAKRLIAIHGRINLSRMSSGRLDEKDVVSVSTVASEMSKAPFHIFDMPSMTVTEIHSHARRLNRRPGGLALLIIDYMTLIQPFARNLRDSQAVRIGEISRALKFMARDLNIPILCVAQLNRQPERDPDRRPMISHLRDSGSIEQDADVILLLHRPAYYEDDPDPALISQAELYLGKNRNGPVCKVPLHWDGACNRFSALDRYTAD